ncbi:hypothetical protein DSO57_1036685 [Entomophthora muscae]|uniref:Uncharacterized protein n=1 Tax=Entomophthora muscae TaxID=34485 RepID=A0ACC2TLA4_9FUNG|nr:hypothetical protein DSO57_1036685 [Entomophthora muscae]
MATTMSVSFDSIGKDAFKSTRPIKVWSSNQAICDEPNERPESPTSPEIPKPQELARRKSTTYAVPGLSYDYPVEILDSFDIPQPFWNKFVAALNAALSEFPSWKDPNSVRRKRGLSFSEGDHEVVCFSSHEPAQINHADRVLKWWNDDYFNEKGCEVKLDFVNSPVHIDSEHFSTNLKPSLSLTPV